MSKVININDNFCYEFVPEARTEIELRVCLFCVLDKGPRPLTLATGLF